MTSASLLASGWLIGWSVAWPPGPINAEMIRRGLARGFWPQFSLGLGASSGDFIWAVAVSLGAGVIVGVPRVKLAMGAVSFLLLLALAWVFLKGAWVAFRAGSPKGDQTRNAFNSARGSYLLGLTLALSSPWNVSFWLGVIGRQANVHEAGVASALTLASGVIGGALTWCLVLGIALRVGARFANRWWDVVTHAATGLLMIYFGVTLLLRLISESS
jgi:L-lysine exporter family protein LysE/ArgO